MSYTNTDLKGYMPNSSLVKNIFNASGSVKSADKKLEAFTNITYLNTRAKGRSETGYGDNNVMQKFIQWGHRELDMNELKDLYIMPDGTQATWNRASWDDSTPMYSNNPYWSRYMCYQNDTRHRVYGNVGVSYNILPQLKVQYKANLDFFVDKQYEVNHEFMAMYNDTFGDYTVGANLGANIMNRRYEYVYGATVGGLAIPLFYNLKNSISQAAAYNLVRKKGTNSIFANVNVGWKNMVYLEGTIRNDKSSTLPAGNNSYVYPSVTASFVFSELLKDKLPWFSFGKLRAGWAKVGNDTDPYQVLSTYAQYTNVDSTTPGYRLPNTLNNADLKPESTTSFEVGLEAAFLNDRIGFDLTYYKTTTTILEEQVEVMETYYDIFSECQSGCCPS